MDLVVAESIKGYVGTPRTDGDFSIFHGGLAAWWEAGAQGYMASHGMANRQIRNITANVGARCEFKIVGDSPEMYRCAAALTPEAVSNARGPWRRKVSASASTSSCPPSFS
jgi:hypothetical protein